MQFVDAGVVEEAICCTRSLDSHCIIQVPFDRCVNCFLPTLVRIGYCAIPNRTTSVHARWPRCPEGTGYWKHLKCFGNIWRGAVVLYNALHRSGVYLQTNALDRE